MHLLVHAPILFNACSCAQVKLFQKDLAILTGFQNLHLFLSLVKVIKLFIQVL